MSATHLPAPRLQLVVSLAPPLSTTQGQHAALVQQTVVPLFEGLKARDAACLALHLGGHLLDYLARHDEPMLVQLKSLQRAAKVEILGGPFYGGLTAHLPEQDVRGQVEMAREFWESTVGLVPQGFYQQTDSWSPELPRLLSETGLAYGFVDDTQVTFWGQGAQQPSLGQIERGGDGMPAFVVASQVSAALAALPPGETAGWLRQALAAAKQHDQQLVTVSLAPVGRQWGELPERLGALWDALAGAAPLPLTLPAASFANRCPAVAALQLRAPTLQAPVPAAEVLQRRMLHTSAVLHQAIGVMEDENLDESWSDSLATVQRLLFAAQSAEAYGTAGAPPGSQQQPDALQRRQATWSRLLQAESMVDALMRQGTDWLQVTAVDLDGDLADDVVVSTPRLGAWLAPGRGGTLYSLDDRAAGRMVFDIDHEPWAAAGPVAPGLSGMGLTQFICLGATLPSGFIAGSTVDRLAHATHWQVRHSGTDADGDGNYALHVAAEVPLPGAETLHIERQLSIRRRGASCSLTTTLKGRCPGFYGLQVPLCLGDSTAQLQCNGTPLQSSAAAQLEGITEVQLQAPDGRGMALHFSSPTRLQVSYDGRSGSYLLVPHVRLDDEAPAQLRMQLELVAP